MRPKANYNSPFLLHRKWTDWAGILHLVTKLKSYASWDVILWNPFKIHAFFSWGLPPCVENTQHQKLHMNWNSVGYYLLNHSCLSTVFLSPKDSQQSIPLKILFLAVRRKLYKLWHNREEKRKKLCLAFSCKLLR